MGDMRESVAAALGSSNLAWNEDHERAIDRIAALARVDLLASYLWRMKHDNEHELFRPAVHLLTKRVQEKFYQKGRAAPEVIRKMCEWVLVEYLSDKCHKCNGTGHNGSSREFGRYVPKACKRCDGTGAYKPNGSERALHLGIKRQSYFESWDSKFTQVHAYISEVDILANREMNRQLR